MIPRYAERLLPGTWCVVVCCIVAFAALGCGKSPVENAPVQPVAFSHKVHAGANGLDCQFCHAYARRSPVAGVPSLQRCDGCHRPMIAAKTEATATKAEVQKVMDFVEKKEPIPWVRVYILPDHVYFSHRVHVQAEVRCQTCHGQVETMERVSQVAPLTMGWCVDCHREQNASRDCLVCHK